MDKVIACVCPGTPHKQDTITLRETLDLHAASTLRMDIAALKQSDPDASTGEIFAILTRDAALFGIERWTLVDEKRKPIEVSRAAIREHIFSNLTVATEVGDAAWELYQDLVLPLVMTLFRSSSDTPIDDSTSATSGSAPVLLRPSKQSSTSTSLTDGTVEISA